MILILIQTVDLRPVRRIEKIGTGKIRLSISSLEKLPLEKMEMLMRQKKILGKNEVVVGKESIGRILDKKSIATAISKLCRRHPQPV